MFQTVIEAGKDGTVLENPGEISKSPTRGRPREAPVALQRARPRGRPHGGALAQQPQALAAQTPHRPARRRSRPGRSYGSRAWRPGSTEAVQADRGHGGAGSVDRHPTVDER